MRSRSTALLLLGLLLSTLPARAQEGETAEERAIIALDQVADITVEWGKGVGRPVESLKIANGKVSDAILAHLKVFKGLRTLEINTAEVRGLKITSSGLSAIAELTELRTLRLSGNAIEDAAMTHLKKLTRLQLLDLSWSKVSDAELSHLKGMTDLRELALSGVKLTDAGLDHLKGMTRLQKLHLGHTKVAGAGLAHLAGMAELTLVDLQGTEMTDKGLKHLPEARRLRWVNLSQTPAVIKGQEDCPKGLVKLEVKGLVAQLLDRKTGKLIGEPLLHAVDRKGGAINHWAFSPDGKLLAIGASYRSNRREEIEDLGQICVWATATGNLVESWDGGSLGSIQSLAFHKDSQTVLFQAARFQVDGK